MLVLREICREGYLSGKRKYFFLKLEKRFTMASICETKDGVHFGLHCRFLIQQHPEKLINLETPAFLNKIETLFKRHLIITPYYPHVLCSRE